MQPLIPRGKFYQPSSITVGGYLNPSSRPSGLRWQPQQSCLWKHRGSPLRPSGGLLCRRVRGRKDGCVGAEVIPDFISAEVLSEQEWCVTATQQRQDPPPPPPAQNQQRKQLIYSRTLVGCRVCLFFWGGFYRLKNFCSFLPCLVHFKGTSSCAAVIGLFRLRYMDTVLRPTAAIPRV